MSGINGLGVTHDPSERLSYYLASAISDKRPNYAAAQAKMNSNRTGMACVTGRAGANRSVTIWLAYAVALLAAIGHCRTTLQLHKRMGRTARSSGLILFRKIHLIRRKPLFAIDRGPCRRRVAAAKKLLINVFMAAAAVPCSQFAGDHEAMVIFFLLAGRGLMAIEAVNTFCGVHAHFVFVNNGNIACARGTPRIFRSHEPTRRWVVQSQALVGRG
jgi:hypothetical protein